MSMDAAMRWTESPPALRYRVDGTGARLLVLLHEMGGSLHSWDAAIPALDDAFRILRFDQRGAGQSEKVRAPYGHDALVDDLEHVLEAAAFDGTLCIAAVAAAGAVAAAYALRHPHRVSGLVLCAPALGVNLAARAQAIERAALVEREGMRAIIDPAMARMYPEAVRGDAFAAYHGRFLANDPVGFGLANRAFAEAEIDVAALDLPILLLAGSHDVRPVAAVEALAARMRQARVEIVEAGHAMAAQAPAAVAAHLRAFFAD